MMRCTSKWLYLIMRKSILYKKETPGPEGDSPRGSHDWSYYQNLKCEVLLIAKQTQATIECSMYAKAPLLYG